MDFSPKLMAEDINFFTDVSGVIGMGGINESEYFYAFWDRKFLLDQRPSIEYLELFAVTTGILLWIHKYANCRICIFVDNKSVMFMINDSTTNCKNCMVLIRIIVKECMIWNVRFFAEHVRSEDNNFADSLSRGKFSTFYSDAEEAGVIFNEPAREIPDQIWPMSKLWKH